MKPIQFFLAYRFLKEGQAQTILIFSGAAAGVAVIVFLASLMTGLQESIIDTTMGIQAHVVVEPEEEPALDTLHQVQEGQYIFSRVEERPRREDDIDQWGPEVERIAADPEIISAAPMASGPASAVRGQITQPIQVMGVEPAAHQAIVDVEERLLRGEYNLDDEGTVIGYELATELGIDLGDRIRFVVAEGQSRSFTVRGIFDLGTGAPNQTWAFVSLRNGQSLLDLAERVTSIEAVVEDLFDADQAAARLRGQTDLEVTSWQEENEDLLRALRTQNASTILISVFVSIAVALGIASVLIVTVVQKRGQVGVLRAMGASMGTILRVFLIQGAVVGLVGSIFGSALGMGLAMGFTNFVRDDAGEVVFPIEPSPSIFVMACLLATLTGLLAAVAPARRAAGLDPADAITHG